jgi:hypothetical protein
VTRTEAGKRLIANLVERFGPFHNEDAVRVNLAEAEAEARAAALAEVRREVAAMMPTVEPLNESGACLDRAAVLSILERLAAK